MGTSRDFSNEKTKAEREQCHPAARQDAGKTSKGGRDFGYITTSIVRENRLMEQFVIMLEQHCRCHTGVEPSKYPINFRYIHTPQQIKEWVHH
jgi:hypothetical protein